MSWKTSISRRRFVAGASSLALAGVMKGGGRTAAAAETSRLAIDGGPKAVAKSCPAAPRWGKTELKQLGEMLKDVGILGGSVVCFMLYLFFKGTFAPILGGMEVVTSASPTLAVTLATTLAAAIAIGLLAWIAAITKFSMGHWLLCALFIIHAMVGAVELGTDGWIQNITGAILDPTQGKILFVLTSLMMFFLRFCAHFFETRLGLKPVALLFVCSIIACLGLNLVSAVNAGNVRPLVSRKSWFQNPPGLYCR